MTFNEVWAVPHETIEEFFRAHGWEADVIPLPTKKIGALSLPQTRVVISGHDAEEIHRQFVLNFLTAGG